MKFTGQVPQATKLSMNADPSLANCTGSSDKPGFCYGNDNSLGNVIVFISDGLAGRTFDVPAEAVTFEQKGCEYAPHVVAVRANQKLKMVNSDNTTQHRSAAREQSRMEQSGAGRHDDGGKLPA